MTEATETGRRITLLLGGTRSGKSRIAEALAASDGEPVTYLATAVVKDGQDDDHLARIAAHRSRRPPAWTTLECTVPAALPSHLAGIDGTVLVDSLGSWVAGHADLIVDTEALISALKARLGATILVSEEVGWSVHPPTPVGRQFVDALGALNQRVAEASSRVLLVVAGRTLELSQYSADGPPC